MPSSLLFYNKLLPPIIIEFQFIIIQMYQAINDQPLMARDRIHPQ